ncbi:MAG TPA: hypothetical protein VGQ10_08315 [Vicinamibacterales bacterium]|jgi:hypothetical protein|nr:hypothetical protein [Vicinamibacterales bacterium]
MRRLALLVTLLGTLMFGLGVAANEGFSLAGRMSATDQEADEGYFAIDQATMIVVKPGSDLHTFLRGQAGRRVRIRIEPDRETEN